MTAGINAGWAYAGPTLLFIMMPLLAACTFIGLDNPALRDSIDWGAQQTVPTCVYLDEGVSRADADQLLGWWNNREANWYKLPFVPVSYEPLTRDPEEFFYFQISTQLQMVVRPDRCVKQIWFVSHSFGDLLYSGAANVLGLPEVMGWTDDATRTKAWVYANRTPDLNQLVMSPGAATRHEMYHLVGCDHFDVTMGNCYAAIENFKVWEREYVGADLVNRASTQSPRRLTVADAVAHR